MGAARVTEPDVKIRPDRLVRRLDELGTIGRDARGGMSRFSFTSAHAAACECLAGWMREAGLDPFLDGAGSLFGVPASPGGPARRMFLLGSHVDTVPMGGTLDGALGVVAAIEAVHVLGEAGIRLVHPPAVAAFADEEGHSFGIGCLTSRAVVGALPSARMAEIRDRGGRTLVERIAAWDCPLPRRASPLPGSTPGSRRLSRRSAAPRPRSAGGPTTPGRRRWNRGTMPCEGPARLSSNSGVWRSRPGARPWQRPGASTSSPG